MYFAQSTKVSAGRTRYAVEYLAHRATIYRSLSTDTPRRHQRLVSAPRSWCLCRIKQEAKLSLG